MKRKFLSPIVCAAALSAGTAIANGVTDWGAIAERVATDKRPPAASEVILGLVHAAMYDAVAATQGEAVDFGTVLFAIDGEPRTGERGHHQGGLRGGGGR